MDQRAGLAGASAGNDQEWRAAVADGFELLDVQICENRVVRVGYGHPCGLRACLNPSA